MFVALQQRGRRRRRACVGRVARPGLGEKKSICKTAEGGVASAATSAPMSSERACGGPTNNLEDRRGGRGAALSTRMHSGATLGAGRDERKKRGGATVGERSRAGGQRESSTTPERVGEGGRA